MNEKDSAPTFDQIPKIKIDLFDRKKNYEISPEIKPKEEKTRESAEKKSGEQVKNRFQKGRKWNTLHLLKNKVVMDWIDKRKMKLVRKSHEHLNENQINFLGDPSVIRQHSAERVI